MDDLIKASKGYKWTKRKGRLEGESTVASWNYVIVECLKSN